MLWDTRDVVLVDLVLLGVVGIGGRLRSDAFSRVVGVNLEYHVGVAADHVRVVVVGIQINVAAPRCQSGKFRARSLQRDDSWFCICFRGLFLDIRQDVHLLVW